MKFFLTSVLILTCLNAKAVQFNSTVHSIDLSKTKQPTLVRFNNGRVIFIKSSDHDTLSAFIATAENNEVLSVKTDRNNFVESVSTTGMNQIDEENELWVDNVSFEPSVLKNTNAALKVFNKMRKDYTKKGECYNRAHVWSYEEHERSKLNSMKLFMFFTEKYIRKYKFHWWFHVTPATYVGSLKSLRTMDRRYTSGPRLTKTWSDVFVKSKRTCKRVSKFDDYWLNQQKQDCYHILTSMYYVIPRDIEKRDLTGKEKVEFSEKELRRAYSNGFNKIIR